MNTTGWTRSKLDKFLADCVIALGIEVHEWTVMITLLMCLDELENQSGIMSLYCCGVLWTVGNGSC
jgi:hypothetical protein